MTLATMQADAEDTNSVFSVTFGWTYTNQVNIQTFRLWEGPSPGFYTNVIATGTSNSFNICRTNWPEEGTRHWYAVTAVNVLGHDSDYSNEIFWPPWPPSHYRLHWLDPDPVQILSSTTMAVPSTNWPVLVTLTGGTNFQGAMTSAQTFFRLHRLSGPPDVLTITSWNPLNAPLNDPRF